MDLKYLFPAGIVAVLIIVLALAFSRSSGEPNVSGGTSGGSLADACTTLTSSVATISNSASSVVLATSSNRAYAKITMMLDATGMATSTPYLAFTNGAAAVVNSGVRLATSTQSIEVGLNTDYPYTGAVSGILLGGGASTVLITTCSY